MKIVTWNVNSIRTRKEIVANWLFKNPVDVLCLQETKVRDEDFPHDPFRELGYHTYIFGQKAYNGVAIFSRTTLTEVNCGFSPILGNDLQEFDLQKRVISGVINNGVRVVNLYVPNGALVDSDKYSYKLRWLKVLKEYLQILKEKQPTEMCVCGDFNIALEDRDIYNPEGKKQHIMSSPLERETLREVLDIGLQDAFRKFITEEGYFSWWDYRAAGFNRNRGWRIDHHYLTSKLYAQATNCWIDIEPRKLPQPSDHTPVILEL